MNNKIMDIVIIAMFSSIVFVLEQALTIYLISSLLFCCFILYTKLLGFKKTLVIVIIHTLLDNLYMGTINPYVALPMLVAWSLIPLVITIFKKVKSKYFLIGFAFVFGFVYGWIMMVGAVLQFEINVYAYLVSDLPFEALMALSGAFSVLILYDPLYKFLIKQPYFENDAEKTTP